jgi:hypothetical protein
MIPTPANDPAINARLASLGEYDYTEPPCPQLHWDKPSGLPPAFVGFELLFDLQIETPVAADYKQLLDEWERLMRIAESLIADAKQCAVELFREVYAEQMTQRQLSAYQDGSGTLSDKLILDALEPSAICVTVSEEGIEAEICFHSKWEDEHGLDFEVTGNVIRRPWREDEFCGDFE